MLWVAVFKRTHQKYRGVEIEEMSLLPKMKLEMVVSAIPVKTVVETARKVLTQATSAMAKSLFTMLKM